MARTCWLCGCTNTKLATDAGSPTCNNGPCQICRAAEEVDDEINQAVITLRRLLAKRCDLRSAQNRAHGSLIHRLPTELTNHIFQLLLPSQNEWGEISHSAGTVLPSFLASICTVWRDIVWSNPFFWTTICLRKEMTESLTNIVRDWILRSRTLPLTLRVEVDSDQGGLNGVIDAISQCFSRCHSLSLDMPSELLRSFYRKVHYIPLRRLRITTQGIDNLEPILLSNPEVSPEVIDIRGVSFRSLQISWNRLSTARVGGFDLEEITQLFQHASQMTYCHISHPKYGPEMLVLPIIHQKLQTLSFCFGLNQSMASIILRYLTLPSLEDFHVDNMLPFSSECLSALVLRSSCPLTKLTFGFKNFFKHLHPLPGVTDLVVTTLSREVTVIKNPLRFFPDLRHLTLRLNAFLPLWKEGIIPLLLEHKRLRPGGPNEGRLEKLLVVDQNEMEFDRIVWNSDIGKGLREMNISLMDDGFEFL